MKMNDYHLLLKLNEVGTIRGTAKSVLISQPAVSQRLKYIEEYFNCKLFIRTPKQLILTPDGEVVLHHANRIVREEQRLKEELIKTSNEVQGTLSIACSTLVSQRFLPAILADFTTRFPKVSIDLVTGISETIKSNHKDYHVCIIRGEQLKESTCKRLFQDPLYIFDTEEFPSDKLKERPLISFKTDDSMNELVENWLHHHQDQIKPKKAIQVDQIETCKQFMMQGLGMAVLPKSVSSFLIDTYPHMPLQLNNNTITRDTWVCYQKGIGELPQVDHFITSLLETIYQ